MSVIKHIGTSAIVCGVLIFSVGVIGLNVHDRQAISKAQEKYNKKNNFGDYSELFESDSIEDLHIKLSSDYKIIKIGKTDGDEIEVKAENIYKKYFSVSQDGKQLTIDEENSGSLNSWNWSLLSFGFFVGANSRNIEILLPEKNYNNIYLESCYCDEINISDINCQKFETIDDCVGNIELSNVFIEKSLALNVDYSDVSIRNIDSKGETTIKSACGDIDINSSDISDSYFELNYGDVDLKNVTLEKACSIDSDCGGINFTDANILCDSNIVSDYGDVEIGISGYIEDYITQIDVSMGDSKINSESKKYYNGKNEKYHIDISNACGEVSVDFK